MTLQAIHDSTGAFPYSFSPPTMSALTRTALASLLPFLVHSVFPPCCPFAPFPLPPTSPMSFLLFLCRCCASPPSPQGPSARGLPPPLTAPLLSHPQGGVLVLQLAYLRVSGRNGELRPVCGQDILGALRHFISARHGDAVAALEPLAPPSTWQLWDPTTTTYAEKEAALAPSEV